MENKLEIVQCCGNCKYCVKQSFHKKCMYLYLMYLNDNTTQDFRVESYSCCKNYTQGNCTLKDFKNICKQDFKYYLTSNIFTDYDSYNDNGTYDNNIIKDIFSDDMGRIYVGLSDKVNDI